MKEKYNRFCESVYVPIFSKPWWMDVVCGKNNWDVCLIEQGGKPVAAMPYYLKEDSDKRIITKPKLTQNNGIIIKYPENQKYVSKLDYEEKIISEICDYIECLHIDRYEQQYHYSFNNWLPFFWRDYDGITRYTYVIEDTSNMANVEKAYTTNARNMIRKAQKNITVIESSDINKFYEINKLTFERQKMGIPFEKKLIQELYKACITNESGKILFAIDECENVHSVALIVWDEQSVYYLVNGTDPKYKNSQANTLLIHESIKTASLLGKKFDFEGSVIKPIEKAFRQFGGIRKPYFRISKDY